MRLSTGHRLWIYWTGSGLFASGVLWLLFHYFVHAHGQFGETAHPLEIWWLRLHGACAMLMLLVLGSLLPVHVRRGWHLRKNLLAGWTLGLLACALIVSGYALYYVAGEATRPWLSACHWVFGLATPLVLTWHVWRGKRARMRQGHRQRSGHTPSAVEAHAHELPASAKQLAGRSAVLRPVVRASQRSG